MHAVLLLAVTLAAAPDYPWLADDPTGTLAVRFAPPAGFSRVPVDDGSFAAWLRRLPLAPAGTPVTSHAGATLRAPAAAVVALDVGAKDLQQCADSIIRLRAEYLFARGRKDDIAFHFTNGDLATFARWARGERPSLQGTSKVVWKKAAPPADDHASLRAYLDAVYLWAGTASLAQHNVPVAPDDVRAGDFFVHGGFPGHAVLVLDVARAPDGRTKALLGQGFMPAQSFHVLRRVDGDAWFDLSGEPLATPSWPTPFPSSSLRRFPERRP